MNKDYYFVILQLPAFRNIRLGSNVQHGFLEKAIKAIRQGRARVVSKRRDTGVSEELRAHALDAKRFRNYLLIQMYLDEGEYNDVAILNKAAKSLINVSDPTVVERADRFCLCAI